MLTDSSVAGQFEDLSWNLRWTPWGRAYEPVHPILRRARVAKTVLVLPHADLAIDGTISCADTTLELGGARGGVAHLWGSKPGEDSCSTSPVRVLSNASTFAPAAGRTSSTQRVPVPDVELLTR